MVVFLENSVCNGTAQELWVYVSCTHMTIRACPLRECVRWSHRMQAKDRSLLGWVLCLVGLLPSRMPAHWRGFVQPLVTHQAFLFSVFLLS